ncbi:7-carboxy-7-deazaguanine synthase QueE [Adhaeretor mobilis]|uniref:7-carboxy-7-deazaguanine synthase n=1 Tax=Adhaeretor mobilis TaxID=1930276 RepID=A0A517MZ62_9BACT|nr:7-carboxy-7-deazaguanine synthase QueE [Adhaeretor mobilis]QDT00155.1 7-carboxy-7-deazaguanine synthase [Adhaeretor mobilis]
MKIAEIYKSIQGEGLHTGKHSVFVRASGCNLRCWFCDTPYASWQPEGCDYTVDEIAAEIEEWDCQHVVLTGGEPMLFSELLPLTETLRASGKHITIETAGTLYLPVECDLMSISPKLAGSAPRGEEHTRWRRRHERQRDRPEIIAQLIAEYDYQLKFVVDEPADLAEIKAYVSRLKQFNPEQLNPERIMLMPQGNSPEELAARNDWVQKACEEQGWTFCPRLQIEWFGPVRGT